MVDNILITLVVITAGICFTVWRVKYDRNNTEIDLAEIDKKKAVETAKKEKKIGYDG